jgi:hypothetical protein
VMLAFAASILSQTVVLPPPEGAEMTINRELFF